MSNTHIFIGTQQIKYDNKMSVFLVLWVDLKDFLCRFINSAPKISCLSKLLFALESEASFPLKYGAKSRTRVPPYRPDHATVGVDGTPLEALRGRVMSV